jgi:hypothetical protein
MNHETWRSGVSLKKFAEASGRFPPAAHWLVAAYIQAKAEGISLEEMVQVLIQASEYRPTFNREQAIKDLGY